VVAIMQAGVFDAERRRRCRRRSSRRRMGGASSQVPAKGHKLRGRGTRRFPVEGRDRQEGSPSEGLATKPVGEPGAGDRHVRFDERGWETERWPQALSHRASSPTLLDSKATCRRSQMGSAARRTAKITANNIVSTVASGSAVYRHGGCLASVRMHPLDAKER
jgi:hypothetical protein